MYLLHFAALYFPIDQQVNSGISPESSKTLTGSLIMPIVVTTAEH
jgi:hypothetical protein